VNAEGSGHMFFSIMNAMNSYSMGSEGTQVLLELEPPCGLFSPQFCAGNEHEVITNFKKN